MLRSLSNRYLDLLGSIYIYNEHRGYTAIDRVLEAVRAVAPDDHRFIAAVEKHRADERKHYLMFRRWFEMRGTMPLLVDRTCGHIDRFVEIMFGQRIDELDTQAIIASDAQFEKLCRVISLTEQRGHQQVKILLDHPFVKSDRTLMKIFRIIEQDEPSHWQPYDAWLRAHDRAAPRWWERAVDHFIHSELLFLKLPALFLTPRLRRRTDWADSADPAERLATPFTLATPG
ncbi:MULTISPECIES: ferritin-like domain-containing protein [unclassified Sphingomonas]|uniref:ferritin-like domain-containing protein n=1 Tax=unclassified Sphingomonas TaxID=196159 RepID=UPI00226A61D5|nr:MULTISPECIES: ferritin-like domain-containing protein [unclassified Sphingomonas]